MTLDGKIATRSGESHISSNADLKRLHRIRSRVDAVMIGIGTQLRDDPRLTVRRVKGESPIRIVVDSLARTPPNSKILSTKEGKTIIAVSKRAPSHRTRRLERAGAKIIRSGNKQVNLTKLLQTLKRMRIRHLLLEGGGTLNWSMLNAKLVDEVWVTVAPFVVGGRDATTLAEGTGVDKTNHAVKLSLHKVTRNAGELRLNYEVRN